jgi:transcription termination factor Rho
MAPKSSSSSGSRRSSSSRKPRKKEDTLFDAEVAASDDLDFGAGIVEDEPAPPKPKSTRSRTRSASREESSTQEPEPVASADEANVETPSHEGSRPSRGRRTRSTSERPRAEERQSGPVVERFEDDDDDRLARAEIVDLDLDDIDLGDDFDDSSDSSDEPEASHQEGEGEERRPRRRRRRRGRRNEGSGQQGGQQGQYRNSGNRQGGQNQSRDYNNRRRDQQGRGGRQNSGSGSSNRGRRVSKFEQNAAPPEPVAMSGTITGVLELHPKGYGFLRSADNDYGARETDAFVSSSFVEKHNLREGIMLTGEIGPGTRGQGPRLLSITSIDGGTVEEYEKRKHFDTLTAINPFEQIKLETGPRPLTMRVMDLLTPIGKGQRALIVAPPRTGKTMLLQDIANAVSINHPEIHLIVLLIDERPEEVTEMRRTVKGEVIASSMDQDVESHVRISQLIVERGKRLAEAGKDCFILMDSITRTARAFNKWVRGGRDSKIQTGGLDVRAMDIPRKMFGTARRFDEGGSLTVCATALIDTGSRMDDAIFQEFKGTGNMELVLSRELAERRIWPAIDISKSGTRREEKILDPELLEGIIMLRRSLVSMSPVEAMDQLIRTLQKFDSNREFLQKIRAVL